ncbi:uncharacterized protein J7T54_002204 [Emericellopsis cladophorae]|uniref:Uncharacterized protein n=1 Tax=Emericellopsis cladophorae TaxID=2686198 RepID=A0A9P9Y3Y0_9HYPO|nr:uncharacterized protein J7T54_002204 [Emericellopsis cladophorae]KAI6783042.1 hypothetical protein J7T54_002204 [Emericellopsis cladophorae]
MVVVAPVAMTNLAVPASSDLSSDQKNDDTDVDIDAHRDSNLEIRQADQDPYVQHVVQTVELIQVVDASGNPVTLQTVLPPPGTVVVDRASGETISVISAPGASWTAIQPSASSVSSGGVKVEASLSVSLSLPIEPSVTASASVSVSSASTDVSAPLITSGASDTPIPASLLPETSNFLTPSAGVSLNETNSLPSHNSTSTPTTPLSQSALQLDTYLSTPSSISFTSTSDDEFRSFISSSSSGYTWDSSFSTSLPSTYSDSETASSDVIGYSGTGADGAQPTDSEDAQTDTDNTDDDSGGGIAPLTPQQKTIVGGVVGSVAGVAFLLLLVMMGIKWKKRRSQVTELLGEQGTREIAGRGGPPTGGSNGGADAMEERPGTGFSVPGALAALTRKSQHAPGEATRSGERGFVRVSGRKLPSVLQHGGDGYSDPRASTMSGESDYWRGSQAFDPGATAPRLALGTPMRPVSGVPIIRSGPGRQAVAEHNPFADPPSPGPPPSGPLPPPPLSRDGLGRSLTSQDGSRGSGSRFQENI